jgi:hypothetical protein
MESKQPPSHDQSDLEKPKPDELEDSVNAKGGESDGGVHKPVKPEVAYVITQEAIRGLVDAKPKPSRLHAILAHP